MATQSTKRKRTKNTSQEQLELYVNYMENDYVFRSNVINPTLDPKYLDNKWKELTDKLNASGTGPSLSIEEWKKRFLDWKYGTRAKYRKMKAHAMGTGGGPQSNITLNDLEERALGVWGMVAVAGASNVTAYEGIDGAEEIMVVETNVSEPSISHETVTFTNTNLQETTPNYETICIINANEENKENKEEKKYKYKKPKPLGVLKENLIKNTEILNENCEEMNNVLERFSEKYVELKKEKLKIQKINLK